MEFPHTKADNELLPVLKTPRLGVSMEPEVSHGETAINKLHVASACPQQRALVQRHHAGLTARSISSTALMSG
jgi:hypothetical protein